ncbi:MAG TPA: GspH/FimT family pseudopilin [Ramlibacter sp.]|uniref:GspH/FimT family pseudopilin n=1 Tax=Ramlibacter sp. TaxID=1917967 RepID=UPI002D6A8AF6|nr:GspH/FimT family pseudopilin [Ramlibacter sp.]HZY19494.1 GspH/FimT family pseudopilin [Ramlibacter sp.]
MATATLAVILGVAVPNMSGWLASMQLGDLSNSFVANLQLARSEAIKRNARVAICKSADGSACAADGDWAQGLIVFHDANNNAAREPHEVLIYRGQRFPPGWRLSGNASLRDYVGYGPDGMTRMESGAFQAGTLTLCRPAQGAADGRQIVINAGGRPRVQRTVVAACGD